MKKRIAIERPVGNIPVLERLVEIAERFANNEATERELASTIREIYAQR